MKRILIPAAVLAILAGCASKGDESKYDPALPTVPDGDYRIDPVDTASVFNSCTDAIDSAREDMLNVSNAADLNDRRGVSLWAGSAASKLRMAANDPSCPDDSRRITRSCARAFDDVASAVRSFDDDALTRAAADVSDCGDDMERYAREHP